MIIVEGEEVSPPEEVKDPHFFIWTIQISQWRRLKRSGLKLLDITVKSGIQAFAPHGYDLKQIKAGLMGEDEYTERYLEKMEESRYHQKEVWDRLSVYPYVAYACYCREGEYCHRHLFKNLAQAHLEGMGWRVKQMGEWHGDLQGVEIPERFITAYPA